MKLLSLSLALLLLIAGCAKQSQELVEPDPPKEAEIPVENNRLGLDMNDAEPEFPEEESMAMVAEEPTTPAPEPVPEPPAITEAPSTANESNTPDKSTEIVEAEPKEPVFLDQRKPRFDYSQEVLFPDSAWDSYMIQKGDFLIKIAKQEYNDWTMWRSIYNWNKDAIGEDPNQIYPYNWLDLLKPSDQVDACKITYFPRTTDEGESLWTIARDVYGDEFAWIVLFWDNEEILEGNDGVLHPGMELLIRETIDPCGSKS